MDQNNKLQSEFNKMLEFMHQNLGTTTHRCGLAIGNIDKENIGIINEQSASLFLSPFGMEISVGVIVLNGTISLTSDYREHTVTSGEIFVKGARNVITALNLSSDTRAIFYMCTRTFLEECVIDRLSSIMNRIITIQPKQVYRLGEAQKQRLIFALCNTEDYLRGESDEIQLALIKSNFLTFFLELIRVALNHSRENMELDGQSDGGKESESANTPATQSIIKRFIALLLEYGDTQHHPSFYADKLCISVQYLSLILKEVTKNTANKWIAGYTLTRAKLYLRQPTYSIQQVASLLNFADQSSFGKFFRKHTGISPKAYREQLNSTNG